MVCEIRTCDATIDAFFVGWIVIRLSYSGWNEIRIPAYKVFVPIQISTAAHGRCWMSARFGNRRKDNAVYQVVQLWVRYSPKLEKIACIDPDKGKQ